MHRDHDQNDCRESFDVGEFLPEDAAGIAGLFAEAYGDGYPIKLFYDPPAIVRANRDRRYVSIVARTGSGRVVGVEHIFPSASCRKLYETGAGLVSKDYLHTGVRKKLMAYLCEAYIPGRSEIEELCGKAFGNGVSEQKTFASFGFKETALEAAFMPAEDAGPGQNEAGRIAAVDAFRCYIPQPHRIYLPPIYAAMLRRIYDHLADVRDIALSDQVFPADRMTLAEMTVSDAAQTAQIAVYESGFDFADHLAHLEHQAGLQHAVVFQVALNLAEPWVGYAVEILRERGYFFGGALPRRLDGDALLMQKVHCPPDFDHILLWSDFSKELLEFIQEDRESTAV